MENMERKSMKTYFDKAKSLPVAMSVAEVKQLISAKGVTSPPNKSWWNLNNLIIMITSILLISAAILTFQPGQFNSQMKAYDPSYTSISFAQLDDYETERAKAFPYIVDAQQLNSKEFVPIQWIQDSITDENRKPLKSVVGATVKTVEEPISSIEPIAPMHPIEPIEPTEPIAPIEEIDKPLESKLGGDFEGQSKTIYKIVDRGGITTLDISHKNGDINIETWDKDKIEISATFSIKAEDSADEQLALDDFDISLNLLNTKAVIESNWDELNDCACTSKGTTEPEKGLLKFLYFSSDGKNHKAKTNNGEPLEYQNFKIVYTIKIPKILHVKVSNQYANIIVPEIMGNLDATVFRGNLTAKNVGGDLDLTVKYGDASVGNYKEGSIALFRSELQLGSGNRLNLKANYSEVVLKGALEINIDAFRTNVIATLAIDELEGGVKYGDITLKGHVADGDLDLFRSNMKGVTFDQLDVSASYSSLVADKATVLNLEEGFRTDFEVREVGNLSGNLKYSQLKIETLKNEYDISAFRGYLEIQLIKADFSSIKVNAKYTNVDFSFSPESKYDLDATTTYTDFKVPEEIIDKSQQNGLNAQEKRVVGTFNKLSKRQASTVSVETFQGYLKLN
ncbi:MAG: hypothetical protein ACI9DK_002155 [Vicingaceae bacterium]|jgi:hypothetical protein